MIRILLPYVYNLAEVLEPLSTLQPNIRYGDIFYRLWMAQQQIEGLFHGSVFSSSLRSSVDSAEALLKAIKQQTNHENTSIDRTLEPWDVAPITFAFTQFKTALLAEFGTFPAYFVSQKGSHDTLTLLDSPARMFPSDLASKVPEAMFDVAGAGKALCYEMPTACGFHLFRATECVLRRYYSHLTGGMPPPKMRTIGVYVTAMRSHECGDEKILSVLEQMGKLHRNPLIHPEVALSLDEAISILGIAHSAITGMLSALPVPLATTTTAQPALDFSAFGDPVGQPKEKS